MLKTAAEIINAQDWKAESGQVINQDGEHVVRVNREMGPDGRPFEPYESDALTLALAAMPAMFKALEKVRQVIETENELRGEEDEEFDPENQTGPALVLIDKVLALATYHDAL